MLVLLEKALAFEAELSIIVEIIHKQFSDRGVS